VLEVDQFCEVELPVIPVPVGAFVARITEWHKEWDGVIAAGFLIVVHMMDAQRSSFFFLRLSAFNTAIVEEGTHPFFELLVEFGAVWFEGDPALPLRVVFACYTKPCLYGVLFKERR